MIRFACPSCGAVFTANDEKGGKTGSCSKCKAQFIIPDALPTAAPPPPPKPAPPQIPVHVPPRTAPQPKQKPPAPMAKIVRDEAPPRSKLFDDDDDTPRKRSKLRDDDDDDVDSDRPKRRNRVREQDDDDERPRRRESRRRSEDDEIDEERPLKKASKKSGMILACGIVCLVAGILMLIESFFWLEAWDRISIVPRRGGTGPRPSLPTQVEIFLVCLQIAIYGAIPTALLLIAGGIGLILHQIWGRITLLVAAGFAAFLALNVVMYCLLLLTYSNPNGNSYSPRASDILINLLKLTLQAVPTIFVVITLFNHRHTKRLRSGFD